MQKNKSSIAAVWALIALCQLVYADNYIVAVHPLAPTSSVTFTEGGQVVTGGVPALTDYTYYDGIGRPYESVACKASPSGADLVTLAEYEGLADTSKYWLPTPFQRNDSVGGIPYQHYTSTALSIHSDTRPYTETKYERSSLRRILSLRNEGNAWSSHPDTCIYEHNAASTVIKFTVGTNGVVRAGYYPADSLFKTTTKDEDYHAITQYVDKFGRLICSTQANSASTYYVYNDLGQLAYVIPPLLADKMTNNTTYADTCADMRRLAYVYKYDTRGHVASKRLPGCDPIYQVYDKGNRLVLTQDGNQRQRGHYWTVTKYDAINRPIYSFEVLAGECSTLTAAQQVCEPLNFVEEYSATNNLDNPLSTTGYSRNLFHVHPMNILVVYYYDDYSFLNLPHTPYGPSLTAQSITGYDAVTSGSVKGMLTGQRVYSVSNGYCTFTAYYYDTRGRLVQQRSYNSWSGVDNTYYALSFTGKPLKVRTEQTFSSITTTEEYHYSYDSQERLIATRYKLNEDPIIQLDSFVYDDLGRVSRKYMLDKIDSVSYTYNIRSQITKLKSSGFEENLYYTTSPVSSWPTAACYNGNVSIATWTYGNKTNGYMYYYDGYNRMSSNYSILDSEWADGYYTESFSYDKQGNIHNLYRWDNADMMNYLSMSYEGNQLVKVTDNGYAPIDYTCKRYQDGENAQKEMFYDKNGALIADFDRKICTIRNNLLTLPDTIQFSNGNQIVHIYDAMGNRLRTTYYTRKVALVEPVCTTIPGTDNLQEYNIVSYTMLGNKRYIRYNDSPWFLDKVMNAEGYTRFDLGDEDYPFYYIKDHLGNIKETYVRTGSNKFCAQRMQYYPSGLPWDESQGASEQPFKYGSKEFVEMHGLDEYDSEARWYYPAIMRTTSMDPLCEKYHSISPYAWCNNNPVNYIDPDGEAWKRTYSYDDEGNAIPNGFEWIAESESYDKNGDLLPGLYHQAIFFSDNGTFDSNKSYNIGSSTATVYLSDGSTMTFDACTYPSSLEKYPTIPEGDYEAYVGLHHGKYTALKMRDLNAEEQTIKLGFPNPADNRQTYAKYINIHKAGINNFTAIGKDGRAVSEGCFVIDVTQWDSFIGNFTNMPSSVPIGIIASRTFSLPINKNVFPPVFNFIYNGVRKDYISPLIIRR